MRDLHQQTQLAHSSLDQAIRTSSPDFSNETLGGSNKVIFPDDIVKHLPQMCEDAERSKLIHKFEADTHRRDKLEEYRTRLSRQFNSTRRDMLAKAEGTPEGATVRDLRKQLTTALIQLLTLEKYETDENPEVISIRKHISSLQMQIAGRPTILQPVVKKAMRNRLNNDAELSQVNTQIVSYDNLIANDLQQFTQLTDPTVQADATASQALSESRTQHTSPMSSERVTALLRNTSLRLLTNIHNTIHVTNDGAVAISILVGLFLSICAVLISDRFDRFIRDEKALRHIIPDAVECIGSIPRMKKS